MMIIRVFGIAVLVIGLASSAFCLGINLYLAYRRFCLASRKKIHKVENDERDFSSECAESTKRKRKQLDR